MLRRVPENLELVENDSYYKRSLTYKGLLEPEELPAPEKVGADDAGVASATQGYGVANWYYYKGEIMEAKEVFEQIIAGESRSAFGYIAAEADLVHLKFNSSKRE